MSLGYPLLGSWSLRYGFHLLGWALSQISYWHIALCHLCPILQEEHHCKSKILWLGIGVYDYLLVVCSVPSCTKDART